MAVPCSELMLTSQDKPAALQLQVLARPVTGSTGQCSNKGHNNRRQLPVYSRSIDEPVLFLYVFVHSSILSETCTVPAKCTGIPNRSRMLPEVEQSVALTILLRSCSRQEDRRKHSENWMFLYRDRRIQ